MRINSLLKTYENLKGNAEPEKDLFSFNFSSKKGLIKLTQAILLLIKSYKKLIQKKLNKTKNPLF